jgi:2-polyprenyl-3-methyl-5-hydroxy-6-metoxy-1,4-benzoquinol methylase
MTEKNDNCQLESHVTGVEEHYGQSSPHPVKKEDMNSLKNLSITKMILKWIGKDHKVLDLGCHEGDITAIVRDQGNHVIGVDLPQHAKAAREKYGLEAIGHDLNKAFPFENDSFDTVIALSILDDIPHDLTFLRECHRVLEPNGRIIVVVPNEVSVFRRIQSLFGGMSRNFENPTGYHTLNHYTLNGIEKLLQITGFTISTHAKCPKRYSKIPLRFWIEKILPITFATNLAVMARNERPK